MSTEKYGYDKKRDKYDANNVRTPTYPSNSVSKQDQYTFQKPKKPEPIYNKPKSSSKKRKCGRKLDGPMPGMPEFEHFPLREIMKEGVSDDGCDDMPFGSFDDWNLSDNEDDANNDYDYVQPTRKPLIFKELMNTKPLEKRKYESKRYFITIGHYHDF